MDRRIDAVDRLRGVETLILIRASKPGPRVLATAIAPVFVLRCDY